MDKYEARIATIRCRPAARRWRRWPTGHGSTASPIWKRSGTGCGVPVAERAARSPACPHRAARGVRRPGRRGRSRPDGVGPVFRLAATGDAGPAARPAAFSPVPGVRAAALSDRPGAAPLRGEPGAGVRPAGHARGYGAMVEERHDVICRLTVAEAARPGMAAAADPHRTDTGPSHRTRRTETARAGAGRWP